MAGRNRHEMKLRIESVDGSSINDYRIKQGHVQVRSLASSTHAYRRKGSSWRMLDDNDIQLHHALGTVVSTWLRVRLGQDRYSG